MDGAGGADGAGAGEAECKALVRRGYDVLGARYDEVFGSETKYGAWLGVLRERLRGRADEVLDLGCGGGVPVARELVAAGHRVVGVDISGEQVRRARRRVPGRRARFVRADAVELDFAPGSFDAVVCLYALIHIPVAEQPGLLGRIASWLRPGGLLVATTGSVALTGTDPDWLGGGVPMWWSQAGAADYRGWLEASGMCVEDERFVPEGDGGHTLFLAHRPDRG
ncbi:MULTISPECIES: class I SAM-dependent methyltransferase [Streptomyces]|uniref:class I SAM-dependent methyltransferase n=1 Tax=Streptomyces TaxID=1883 RepID=UPI00068D0EEC|nr:MULTISPECIES: class I SAM-dependent methyltransferase [Streptomyces]